MKCSNCKCFIIMGWVKENEHSFCSEDCKMQWKIKEIVKEIKDSDIEPILNEIYYGECEYCKRVQNNNYYNFYYIISFLVITNWSQKHKICCQSCAKKTSLKAIVYSFFFGWWWFPWGLSTPATIFRNLRVFFSSNDGPNKDLKQHVKESLAMKILQNQTTENITN